MKRIVKVIVCIVFLRGMAACGDAYVGANTTQTGTSTTVTTDSINSIPWTAIETGVLTYTLGTTLNTMFEFSTTGGSNDLPTTTGTQFKIDLTSPCGTSFDSNGTINVLGTFTPNSANSAAAFNLSENFLSCPMYGQDGKLYTIDGENLVVNGNVTTTTNSTALVDNYVCPQVTGTLTITDPNNNAILCSLNASAQINYVWNSNLTITDVLNGTVCNATTSSTVNNLLPVAAP